MFGAQSGTLTRCEREGVWRAVALESEAAGFATRDWTEILNKWEYVLVSDNRAPAAGRRAVWFGVASSRVFLF